MISLSTLWAMLPACEVLAAREVGRLTPFDPFPYTYTISRCKRTFSLSQKGRTMLASVMPWREKVEYNPPKKGSVFTIPFLSYEGTTKIPFLQVKTEIFFHFFSTFSYLSGGENIDVIFLSLLLVFLINSCISPDFFRTLCRSFASQR